MENKEKALNGLQMNEETLGYFLKGLRIAIKKTGMTQAKFARGVPTSAENLSNVLNGKTGTSEEMREALAKRAGMDVPDIVAMGKELERPPQETKQKQSVPSVPGVKAGWVEPMDVLSTVSNAVGVLAKQCQEESGKKRFWREMFNILPIAALVIKDDIIWYQNIKSRDWGNLKGVTLCESCACPEDCKRNHECPSYQAIETGNPRSGHQFIGRRYYKVDVVPLHNQYRGHRYFIIFATEEKAPPDDRRGGEDRRELKS